MSITLDNGDPMNFVIGACENLNSIDDLENLHINIHNLFPIIDNFSNYK